MIAKTFYGFEEVLARELRSLGAGNIEPGVRSVSFDGDTGFMYKANLCLRTALKILKPVHSFRARNERELYQKVYAMDWESVMSVDNTLSVSCSLKSDVFTHSLYISQKVKDAIVDKFRDSCNKRPSVDTESADLRIHLHVQDRNCEISLDSSGASLHHRGYRQATNIAPINEVLAAGLLLLSGWEGHSDFLDPMCGSGTLPIEAAMIACNIPANLNRKGFAFEKWPDYDSDLYDKILEASLRKTKEFHFSIKGMDKAPSAVSKARENVENANLTEYISIEHENFFNTVKESERRLHMLFNPPYGERLNIDFSSFYSQIGDTLKKGYPDTEAWFITSNLEALKHVGLRPSRKIKVFNARLESRLVKYEMYKGSKKAKFNKPV